MNNKISNHKDSKKEKMNFVMSTIFNTAMAGFGAISSNPLSAIDSSLSVFSNIVGFSISNNLKKYVYSLAEDMVRLESEISDFKIENLRNNDFVATTVLQSIQIAVRNYQNEKHEALRNAVLNTAINQERADEKLTYLRYIDELSPLHIKILKFLENNSPDLVNIYEKNKNTVTEQYGSQDPLIEYFENQIPESKDSSHIYIRDLMNRSLLNWERMMLGHDLLNVAINGVSESGHSFLRFIESPLRI